MTQENGKSKEINLGDDFGDVAKKVNGVRIEIRADGSVAADADRQANTGLDLDELSRKFSKMIRRFKPSSLDDKRGGSFCFPILNAREGFIKFNQN